MMKDFFETASFHIVKPCNMACKFCYATFQDMNIPQQIARKDVYVILDKLRAAGLQKITFAGGEPLLYKHLYDVLEYSRHIGLTTSIITNGSLLSDAILEQCAGIPLDWIGISIDSLDVHTNNLIGRTGKNNPNYYELVSKIKRHGFKLKINTVVNKHNKYENLSSFIYWAQPDRWKVFQALCVEGQNEKQFNDIKVNEFEFNDYIQRHRLIDCLVPENNEAMTGSYLLIDPQGRLFENSKGKHTYSSPLQNNSMEKCLSEINLDRGMFIKRGGLYRW